MLDKSKYAKIVIVCSVYVPHMNNFCRYCQPYPAQGPAGCYFTRGGSKGPQLYKAP